MDVIIGFILLALSYAVMGLFYNRIHMRRLLERGYCFADTHELNELAAKSIGVDVHMFERR